MFRYGSSFAINVPIEQLTCIHVPIGQLISRSCLATAVHLPFMSRPDSFNKRFVCPSCPTGANCLPFMSQWSSLPFMSQWSSLFALYVPMEQITIFNRFNFPTLFRRAALIFHSVQIYTDTVLFLENTTYKVIFSKTVF